MSELIKVTSEHAPAALGAYSQAVKANGFVFASGQLGLDPATGQLAGETAGEQAAQALKNIANVLEAAGTDTAHVVRATIYMKHVEDFHEIDAAYAAVFNGDIKPARVAFGGNDLPAGALVEIETICQKFNGGPVGLSTIAVSVGEEPDTIEEAYVEHQT